MPVGRFTNADTSRRVMADLQSAYERVQETQRRLSSGREIQAPEDDPFGTGRAVTLRTQRDTIAQHVRNIEDGQGLLQQADVALDNVTGLLQRVRELTVQAANTTLDQEQLNAIAEEIAQVRSAVREQMNTTFAGRYVFAGSATLTPPYPDTGGVTWPYAGNDEVVKRVIGDTQQMDLNIRGWEAFSVPPTSAASGQNVLAGLTKLESDLRTGDRAALGGVDIDAVDGYLDQVAEARAKVGARTNRLDTNLSQLKDAQLNVEDLLSKTEDVDVARAMVDFSSQQATYESALRTTARVLQRTLVDFLG